MTIHQFSDHPKIPPSKAFRPVTKALVVAANALAAADCVECARAACETVDTLLQDRPKEECDGSNPTALKFARLRFDQERRHVETLLNYLRGHAAGDGDRAEAARIVLASVEAVLTEMASARAVAPELSSEVSAKLPVLQLPDLPKPDYSAMLETTRPQGV